MHRLKIVPQLSILWYNLYENKKEIVKKTNQAKTMVEEKFVPLGDSILKPAEPDKFRQQGEGSSSGDGKGKQAERIEVREEADLAVDVENISTREELLSYLETLDSVKTAPWKKGKKKGRGRTYASADFIGKVQSVFNNPSVVRPESLQIRALAGKVKQILALESKEKKKAEKKRKSLMGKEKKDSGTEDQLFDALGISDRSFPEEPASGEAVPDSAVQDGRQKTADPSAAESATAKPETEKVTGPEEGNKIVPEGSPEERERRTQERKERLAQLKTEIDQSRKEYLEDEYKKTNSYARLRKFFGMLNQSESEDERREKLMKEDSDLAHYRAYYDNNLFEYKNLLLEDAKERKVSNEELGNIVKVFALEANINMMDTHTDVKIEHHEGSISGKLKDFSLKMIESYRKLPTGKKLAIGAGFLGVGALTGAAGIGVGAFATATALRRFFMGAVTGTAVTTGLEMRGRGKTEQRIDEATKVFAETAEKLDEEKKYEAAQRAIDQLIYDEDQKIRKIKNKNIRNLALGVGVGTLVGSASHWLGMLRETETGKEIFGGINGGVNRVIEYFKQPGATIEGTGAYYDTDAYNEEMYQNAKGRLSELYGDSQPGTGAAESLQETGAPGALDHAEAPVGPALENPVNLEIQSGSSLEGTIIKNLESAGMSADEAGAKAHSMAVEYAKEKGIPFEKLNETFPGQELKLSPDGTKIIHFSGEDEIKRSLEAVTQPEASPEADSITASEAEVPEAEAPAEDIGSSGTEDGGHFVSESETHHGIEVPENGTGEYLIDAKTSAGITEMESALNQVNGQLDELDGKILKIASGQYEGEDLWPGVDTKLDELRMQKQMLEQTKENLIARIYSGHVGSLRKLIYGGIAENIDKVGKMPAAELLDNKNSLGYKFFARVMDSHSPQVVELQRHVSPLKGEKVEEWIIRIAKIMKKSGIRKI